MFKNLTNMQQVRTPREALGFYIAYLFLIILVGMLASLVIASFLMTDGESARFETGLNVGALVATIFSVGLTFLILKEKNLLHFGYLLALPFIGLLAFYGGGVCGLLPVAYLTTKALEKSEALS